MPVINVCLPKDLQKEFGLCQFLSSLLQGLADECDKNKSG